MVMRPALPHIVTLPVMCKIGTIAFNFLGIQKSFFTKRSHVDGCASKAFVVCVARLRGEGRFVFRYGSRTPAPNP